MSIPSVENWILLGDFNFRHSPDNRNKEGGNINDMFLFNEIIGLLGLLELPLKGRSYTWSNMQRAPLLEQLDWLAAIGLLIFLIRWCFPWLGKDQTMSPALSTLILIFPKLRYFILKTIGSINQGFWSVLRTLGLALLLNSTVLQFWQMN
jgi:hypothetical protein